MSRMPVGDLTQRIKLAWNETELFRTVLDDAYSIAAPNRNEFSGMRTPGDQPGNEIFDSTLMHSLTRFANRVQTALFPAFQNWSEFVPGDTAAAILRGRDEKQLNEMQAKADGATAVCFSSIHNSNFSQAVHEMLLDLAFGTGAMLVNELPVGQQGILECVSANPADIAIDSGPYGKVWGIFRKHEVRPHLMKAMWPDFKEPPNWAEVLKNSETTKKTVTVDEASYYDQESDRWRFDIIYYGTDKGKKGAGLRVVERTTKHPRWIIPRWSRMSGQTRGSGPVLEALPTAKSLNKAKELLLINSSFQIHPMFSYIDDGIFNPAMFKLIPGEMNAVSANGGPRGRSIETIDVGGDLRLTQFIFENLQMDIKKIMLDEQLPPEQGGVRSATEWTARQNELANAIGAPFGRIYAEFIQPFMRAVLEIHVTRGILEEFEIDGHTYDLQVTAPFAQAQNINEVNTAAQLIELVSMLGEEVLNLSLKTENFGAYFARKMGVPMAELVRTEEEREEIQERTLAMQQAQMENEQSMAMEQQAAGQQQGA